MALSEGQVQVRDLVMGPNTPYRMLADFNPWELRARVDASAPRSGDHGSWSGAEWTDEVVIPMPVQVGEAGGTVGSWMALHQALAAAFAPSHTDVELRWMLGGVEWMMRGRPRMVTPEPGTIGLGYARTRCAFVALDPRIYSGQEVVGSTGLPSSSGGLRWPAQWPQRWDATVTAGLIRVENAGTSATRPRLIVHGPVVGPQVALVGSGRSLAWDVELSEGQWMDVDLGRRTSLINGQVSRTGAMTSRDWFDLPPGVSELAFSAQVHDPASLLTVAYRSAWQ